jgi:hypothetical protein
MCLLESPGLDGFIVKVEGENDMAPRDGLQSWSHTRRLQAGFKGTGLCERPPQNMSIAFFFLSMGFELGVSHLLGRCSTS